MGLLLSLLRAPPRGQQRAKLLLLGLDAAGKTTVLHRLKLQQHVRTIPTIGFNVESVECGGFRLTIWDVGGQEILRKLWQHHYRGAQGVVFVVDSSDRSRVQEAAEELHRLLRAEELAGAPLLVLANKQDLPRAMTPAEVAAHFKLEAAARGRRWSVRPTCATTGDGLARALRWLAAALPRRAKAE
mmetsp:Transcript_87751/g.284059  ORF Transcript_87751/g.284059 Transcript_87751/m.284059 type:complete len:186 (+) Transcript_87751:38-595(+)